MSEALDELLQILDLEAIEVNIFRGRSPLENRQRVFGGQVAGQALIAAGRTVDNGEVHSLHAYFLRPGDPSIPILYEVDRIRDGASFTTRRVVGIQHGKAIFNLSASFHKAEVGVTHQMPMPQVPPPETLPTFQQRMATVAARVTGERNDWYQRPRPIDQRYVDPLGAHRGSPNDIPPQRVWMRADGEVPNDPLLHACIVAYASDMSLLSSAMIPHNITWDDPNVMSASLDHAMWFHKPLRTDEWFLYDQESPWAGSARALARGQIFSSEGDLCVSVVQEGLVRLIDANQRPR